MGLLPVPGGKALVPDRLPEDRPCSYIAHSNASDLAQERYGTRAAGIDLKDVHPVLLINDKLDIIQPYKMEASADTCSIINDSILNILRDHLRRIHGDRIPGMDACTFNMLHNTRDINIFAVSNSIRFQLPAHDVAVYKDRRIVADLLHRSSHIDPELTIIMDDLHGTPAQDIAGPYKHGITDTVCNDKCFINSYCSVAFGLRYPQPLQSSLKFMAVFSPVNILQ